MEQLGEAVKLEDKFDESGEGLVNLEYHLGQSVETMVKAL